MDAVKYLKTLQRICKSYQHCGDCPNWNDAESGCGILYSDPRMLVETAEQWAKEHPVETRQSRFLKEFPDVIRTKKGAIGICPKYVDTGMKCGKEGCEECKQEYWSEEIEDEGN